MEPLETARPEPTSERSPSGRKRPKARRSDSFHVDPVSPLFDPLRDHLHSTHEEARDMPMEVRVDEFRKDKSFIRTMVGALSAVGGVIMLALTGSYIWKQHRDGPDS